MFANFKTIKKHKRKFRLSSESGAGFTLIELAVVIVIITVLYGIILFSVTQYINKGKDSNISGNLAVLIPAGEVYYNGNGSSGYAGFCSSTVFNNAVAQMPANPNGNASCIGSARVCCSVTSPNNDAWAACAREFTNPDNAYCVDSRGVKKEICNSSCLSNITVCHEDDITSCQ